MPDRSFAAAVIARRFGYTRPNADAIAAMLSGDELDIVEQAARDSHGPVRIATVIFNARLRAARKIADTIVCRRAIMAARLEAQDHFTRIGETVPQVGQKIKPGTDVRGETQGIRLSGVLHDPCPNLPPE